jgi:tetratricopeptide (TPR) repeat protein
MVTFLAIIGAIAIIIFIVNNVNGTDPNKVEMYFTKALSAHNRGDYHEAINILNEAIIYCPTNYQLWNNRGNSKYELGWFEEAIKDFNKSIELNSDTEKNMMAYMNKEKALAALRWDNGMRTSLINKMMED